MKYAVSCTGLKEHENCSIAGLMSASGTHAETIQWLQKEHSIQTKGIIYHMEETFQSCYKVVLARVSNNTNLLSLSLWILL
jgi:ribosome biogenesis GTPase A